MQYQRKKEVTKHTHTLTSPPPSLRIQEGSLAIEPRVDSMGVRNAPVGSHRLRNGQNAWQAHEYLETS